MPHTIVRTTEETTKHTKITNIKLNLIWKKSRIQHIQNNKNIELYIQQPISWKMKERAQVRQKKNANN